MLASMAKTDFGHKVQPVHIDIRNNPAHYWKRNRWKPLVLWYQEFHPKPDISHGGIQNQQEDFEEIGNGFLSWWGKFV